MILKFLKYSSALAVTSLFLTGCNSGSSGVTTTESISGKVLGSLIQGAKVCVDENLNGRCDSTDGFTVFTDVSGGYTIGNLTPDLFNLPIVVEVPQNALIVDPVTGSTSAVGTEYRLSFPPSELPNRFVSSLSTLVSSEYARLGNIEAAKTAVADQLNSAGFTYTTDELLENYVDIATADDATAEDIKNYNGAKLAGQVLRESQAITASNDQLAAEALLELAVDKVFLSLDLIEVNASNSETLINQVAAELIVETVKEAVDLEITAEDVELAEQLALQAFDLGSVSVANVFNFKQADSQYWSPVSFIRFNTPGGSGGLSPEEYRAQIPESFEIGVVNSAQTLLQVIRFDQQEWAFDADVKYDYGFDNQKFFIYLRDETGTAWAAGDYDFVLCPLGCDQSTRIVLGTGQLEPYDETLDIAGAGNVNLLSSILSDELQFITSDRQQFRDANDQYVWVSIPPPPHGSYYRAILGVDDGDQLQSGETRATGIAESFDFIKVPNDWIDTPQDFLAILNHRDRIGLENVSWEVSMSPVATQLTRASSYLVDNIFDVYRAEQYIGESTVREGYDSELRLFVSEDNGLVELAFVDENDQSIVSTCLPSDLRV